MNKQQYSAHNKIAMLNVIFSEAVERSLTASETANITGPKVEIILNEIWDDTLNRIFCGASAIVSMQSDIK